MIYKFKPERGGSFHRAELDAQAVGEELERIRIANAGKLDTTVVVQEATAETSPLHKAFTWDDTDAAYKWRLSEAQSMIRNIVIVEEQTGEVQKAFYTIQTVTTDGERENYYQSASVIARSPEEYSKALRVIIGDLAGAEASLERLQRLAPKTGQVAVRKATAHVTEAHKTLMAQQAP